MCYLQQVSPIELCDQLKHVGGGTGDEKDFRKRDSNAMPLLPMTKTLLTNNKADDPSMI